MANSSKSISKYFKEGDLITNLHNLASAHPGYISAKKLHSQNIINEDEEDEDDEEEDEEKQKEDISDFLSNGNYYVPSYLTFLNDENDHENDNNKVIENITITITPVEKCNPIDDELYNKLVESAEIQKNNNTKNKLKNKKTKKILNNNNKNKKLKGGGKKTKRKN